MLDAHSGYQCFQDHNISKPSYSMCKRSHPKNDCHDHNKSYPLSWVDHNNLELVRSQENHHKAYFPNGM